MNQCSTCIRGPPPSTNCLRVAGRKNSPGRSLKCKMPSKGARLNTQMSKVHFFQVWNLQSGESRWHNATPKRWQLLRSHDKAIHGSCAIYFPGGIYTGTWLSIETCRQLRGILLNSPVQWMDTRPLTTSWYTCEVLIHVCLWSTPPKFNMEPEDHGFQKDFPFPGTYFQVPC